MIGVVLAGQPPASSVISFLPRFFCLAAFGLTTLVHGQQARPDIVDVIKSGEELAKAGHLDEAISTYTEALNRLPNYWALYVRRAAVRTLKEDWQGALEDLNRANVLMPKRPDVLSARAYAQLHLGNIPAAEADFTAAEQADPVNGPEMTQRFLQQLISKARAKGENGNDEGAIKDLDMIIALVPDLGIAYHERGAAKGALKRYKEAVADFDLAIKYDSWHNTNGDTHRLRAAARRALGDIAGAEADEAETKKRVAKAQEALKQQMDQQTKQAQPPQ